MKREILILAVMALLLCPLGVAAQDESTFAEVEAKALQGDFKCMDMLGRAYRRGLGGVEKDEEKSVRWYKAAFDKAREEAAKDNKDAVVMLLNYYAKPKNHGNVVGRDSVEFARWYRKALDLECYPVQCFQVERDVRDGRWTEAVRLLKKIVDSPENPKKEYAGYLGECYYYGRGGLQRNYALAYKYFKMQIDGGSPVSKESALSGMGLCCYYGRGVQKNTAQAVKYWLEKADYLTPEATYMLGYCQVKGIGTPKDVDAGMETLRLMERPIKRASDEMKEKARQLVAETEGEVARQQFLAEQKRRQEEARLQAERERQNLIYEGPYTQTGLNISYADGSCWDTGEAQLHQVKLCRDVLYVDGKAHALVRNDGLWMSFGQNQGHAEYMYNTETHDIRQVTLMTYVITMEFHNIWARGSRVAEFTRAAYYAPAYPTYGGGGGSRSGTTGTTRTSHRCSRCDGTGLVIANDVPDYGNRGKKYCEVCHTGVGYSHYHKQCQSCKGKGYW